MMPQRNQLPIQPIAGRARFVAEMQLCLLLVEFAYKAFHRRRRRLDLAKITDLRFPALFGYGNRVLRIRYINTDVKNAMLNPWPALPLLGARRNVSTIMRHPGWHIRLGISPAILAGRPLRHAHNV